MMEKDIYLNIKDIREVFRQMEQNKREEFLRTQDDYSNGKADAYQAAYQVLDTIPVANVHPISYSKWEPKEYGEYFECGNCEFSTDYHLTPYCPQCGSRMIDVKEDST